MAVWVLVGWVFIFFLPGCCATPCRVTESDDCTAQPERWHQAPLRPGSFTCLLGRCRPGCPNGPDTQASLEVRSSELSVWPHKQICPLSAEPLLPSKRDEHERASGWDVRVIQCDSAPPAEIPVACSPAQAGWREAWQEAGISVAKNMNSFHVLGVRGGHPVLTSSLQTDQQNGPFLDGALSYLFFLSQEIRQRDKITIAKIYFRVIMCTHLYPFINPMECGNLDDLFKQRGVRQRKMTCSRSQSYISNKIGIQNLVRLRVHTLNRYRESSANRGWKRTMVWGQVVSPLHSG